MDFVRTTIRYMRSYYLTKQLKDCGAGRIKLATPFIQVKITKQKGSKVQINGRLSISPNLGGNSPISITMGANSKLVINGDFVLGDGCKIFIGDNAELTIGGRKFEDRSGLTSDVIIMVYRKIEIGKDFLCSWNVFITDCDWHVINNISSNSDVSIGDHVWIGNNCSILKGTIVDDNCIITSYSKLANKNYPANVMIGGIPANILKKNVSWSYSL